MSMEGTLTAQTRNLPSSNLSWESKSHGQKSTESNEEQEVFARHEAYKLHKELFEGGSAARL